MDTPINNKRSDYVYKEVGGRKISLTFIPPEKEKYEKAPVYFIIPGGGWHYERKEDMLDFSKVSVDALVNEGFATVSIDYRVSAEEGVGMEEIISDCFDAARYISHFADVLKIDREKFFLSGHSAGGHLALMLAYAPGELFKKDSELKDGFKTVAVMPMSPPTILNISQNPPTHALYNLYEVYNEGDSEERRRLTSPYEYVSKNSPPTLLAAGTSDRLVYPNSSELLYDKLIENGVEAKLILSLAGGHVFEKMHKEFEPKPDSGDIQKAIIDFAISHT